MLKSKNLSSILRSNAGIFTAFALFLIMLLGLALRSYRLDQSPYGALVDELHFGYIAHSLNTTGADEHGVSWPLVFKGFGDQKLPAYAYLLMPVVRWLGLSVQSIRWPSVISGTILIGLIFWLGRTFKFSRPLALAAAFLTAVSPWPFWLSRFGLESNLSLTAWTAGLISLSTIKDKHSNYRLILTGFLFALTWYCYIAYWPISVAILILYLGFRFFHKSLSKKSIVIIFGSFLLAILPMLLLSPSGSSTARLNQIGIFADPGIAMKVDEKRTFCTWLAPKQLCYISWNKPLLAAQTVISRYLMTFSPEYLVLEGEGSNKYTTVEGFGQFMPAIYPFLLLGLMSLLFQSKANKLPPEHRFLLITGLLIAIIPSALSSDPQKVRLSAAFPFFALTIILGIAAGREVVESIGKLIVNNFKRWQKFILVVVGLFMSAWFMTNTVQYFMDFYFVHTQKNDKLYNSFVRDLMTFVGEDRTKYKVVMKQFISDPVMHYAFYTQLDPKIYQQTVVMGPLEESGFQHTIAVDNFRVDNPQLSQVACQALNSNEPIYFVTDEILSESIEPVETFTSANGVYVYANVYDALEFAQSQQLDCQDDI